MAQNMGLSTGGFDRCFKRKFRWMFYIQDIIGDQPRGGVNTLPPSQGARPSISFKEMELQGLHETISRPSKPSWKTIQLTLYDLKTNTNPVFEWIQRVYDPCGQSTSPSGSSTGNFFPSVGNDLLQAGTLLMYDGCGNILEQWLLEACWPMEVEWSDLDMSDSSYTTIVVTLRYDRAKLIQGGCSNRTPATPATPPTP